MNKILKITKSFVFIATVLTISFSLSYFVFAWSEPTAVPPAGNVLPPLNVGPTGQSKEGGLILNTGGADIGLIVDKGIIGIGTQSPAYDLHIKKIANAELMVESDADTFISLRSNTNSHTNIEFRNSFGVNTAEIHTHPNDSSQVGLQLRSMQARPLSFWIDGSDRMLIKENGNVGIGTTDPWVDLNVKHNANSYQGIAVENYDGGNLAKAGASFITDAGNFFIGRTGTGYAYSGDAFMNVIGGVNDGIRFILNDADRVYFAADGNVGIGTISPNEKLEVAGNVKAVAFLYSSDARLKENIQKIDSPLEKILKLNGVSFNWKNSGEKGIGLIAQNVEDVFPELVKTDNVSGIKSVGYGNLVAPLIEATKEQQKAIENLQKEIAVLKSELNK